MTKDKVDEVCSQAPDEKIKNVIPKYKERTLADYGTLCNLY
ncbi:MAG TPA: hypothetical protein VJH90_02285 [archaeon]|nr:hypothetical protein [archaeon]